MPVNWNDYPKDWKQIAKAKKESVGWKCEICGKQCKRDGEPYVSGRLILTVAHLNHNPMDCRPENLMAMCAPCHLRYDAEHHRLTRTRQPKLFGDDYENVDNRRSEEDEKSKGYT